MALKLIVGLVLIVGVVDGWPCKKAAKKLDKCRSNGYVIGDCEVGDGKLTNKLRKKCGKLDKKYQARCGAHECDTSQPKGYIYIVVGTLELSRSKLLITVIRNYKSASVNTFLPVLNNCLRSLIEFQLQVTLMLI